MPPNAGKNCRLVVLMPSRVIAVAVAAFTRATRPFREVQPELIRTISPTTSVAPETVAMASVALLSAVTASGAA
ncbi:hypothetical protein D3C87_2125980 [compost metagenome]